VNVTVPELTVVVDVTVALRLTLASPYVAVAADGVVVVAAFATGETVTTALALVCVQFEPVKLIAVRATVAHVYGVATPTLGAVATMGSFTVSAAVPPFVRASAWLFADALS
jgi:hypothetical protein